MAGLSNIPGGRCRVFIIINPTTPACLSLSEKNLGKWSGDLHRGETPRTFLTCEAPVARPCSAAPASSSWGSWGPLWGRCPRPSRSKTSRWAPRWRRRRPGPRRGPAGPGYSHWAGGPASAGLISVIDLLWAGTCLIIESNITGSFRQGYHCWKVYVWRHMFGGCSYLERILILYFVTRNLLHRVTGNLHRYFSSSGPLHMIVMATLKERTLICPVRWL